MFTYINENFLHAPSTDLSRETVKTLIAIMLAQAQEVFLEKQIADGKKVGLLAKLASQAAVLYSQAVEGAQENVQNAIFEKVWLLVCQVGTTTDWMWKSSSQNTDQITLHVFGGAILPSTCR
jgi:programmed cell death 6-interacting protein